MQKVTVFVVAFFIILLVFIPLLSAIQSGLDSTELFYEVNF
jgi:pilus assembly protein TadC